MNPFDQPELWHSRGYLPHFEGGEILQFVTFRLYDSVPKNVIEKWKLELENSERCEIELRNRIEEYVDRGNGQAFMNDSRIAALVQNSLMYFDKKKYRLISWVVMPNHVHILICPIVGHSLAAIMHSIKSFTAHKANALLNRSGDFWMHESYDRFIRNREHFERVISYIENNPVKAGLCARPSEWKFGSAFFDDNRM